MKIRKLLNEETHQIVTELSNNTMASYRQKATVDAMAKHREGGANNEIEAVRRAKNIARAVRIEVKRRRSIHEKVMDMPIDAAKARLAKLKADYEEVRGLTRYSEKDADAIDEIRDEIEELRAYLRRGGNQVNEAAATAQSSYEARAQQIRGLMVKIQQKLDAHAQQQTSSPQSWSYAGDLAYVAEQLQEILAFLSSEENPISEAFGTNDREFSPDLVQAIARGELDIRDAMGQNDMNGRALQRMYDVIAAEQRLHPDDNAEDIYDRMYDEIAQKYGVDYGNDF